MARREAQSRKASIKAASVAGSARPQQIGGHAPAEWAVHAGLPVRQAPQLSQVVETPPGGKDWISEIKFDGYRLVTFLSGGKARILSRNGLDWTSRLPALAHAIAKLNVEAAILDGELVALDSNGVSSFAELQRALSEGHDSRLFYYVFDLLYLNGWDLRPCALLDRKKLLATLSNWKGLAHFW